MELATIPPADQPEQQGEEKVVELEEAGNQPTPQQVETSWDPEGPTGPTQGAEGDAAANLEAAPQDPKPSTSTSTSTAEISAYMTKWQGYGKKWFEEVAEKKEEAYGDLIASLIGLVKEQNKTRDLKVGVAELDARDIDAVIESIPDMSSKYIQFIGHYQVEVLKEEEEIDKKRLTEKKKDNKQQRALNEYYDAAKDLCRSQAIYMAKVENLHKVIENPDQFLAIINHVQLPAVQVMVTTKE